MRRAPSRIALAAAAALTAALAAHAGCSSGNVRSCAIEDPNEQPICVEYQRASDEAVEREARPACARRSGRWSNEPCSRTNLVAGCMQRIVTQKYGAHTQVTWYYVANTGLRTAPDVGSACRAQDGTALSP